MDRPIYESDQLLSDEEILKLGIKKQDIESYRRKFYNVKTNKIFKNRSLSPLTVGMRN
jgi:hypothetical protein